LTAAWVGESVEGGRGGLKGQFLSGESRGGDALTNRNVEEGNLRRRGAPKEIASKGNSGPSALL